MNKSFKNYQSYESGELRIGISAPDDSWIKADGKEYQKKDVLFKKLISANYLFWTTRSANFHATAVINGLAYGNGIWVAVGNVINASCSTSTDGISWTTRTINLGSKSVAYGNGIFVAVGTGTDKIKTSTDGITWVSVVSNFVTDINTVAYGNGLWVAGGVSGAICSSTDGTNWVTRTSNFPGSGTPITGDINSIAYGNGLWIATGYGGNFSTSTDGISWTTRNNISGSIYEAINIIAYNNGLWVAAGDTKGVYTSVNGLTSWRKVIVPHLTSSIYTIAYGNGIWLVGGIDGSASTQNLDSKNPVWIKQANFNTTPGKGFRAAAYGNNAWVIGGNNGVLQTAHFEKARLPNLYFNNNIWGWIKK